MITLTSLMRIVGRRVILSNRNSKNFIFMVVGQGWEGALVKGFNIPCC